MTPHSDSKQAAYSRGKVPRFLLSRLRREIRSAREIAHAQACIETEQVCSVSKSAPDPARIYSESFRRLYQNERRKILRP